MSRPPPSPWASLRVAVVGVGRLGTACARALLTTPGLRLAALVRRPASLSDALPPGLPPGLPVCEAWALRDVDAALVYEALHKEALRQRCPAMVGAGWDPGALPMLRGWLALLVPKGHTAVRLHATAKLHHTLAARDVAGVREALATERRTSDGRLRHYVYVELEPGTDADRVCAQLASDPLFVGNETEVVPVDSLAALEQEGEGVVLERCRGRHPAPAPARRGALRCDRARGTGHAGLGARALDHHARHRHAGCTRRHQPA